MSVLYIFVNMKNVILCFFRSETKEVGKEDKKKKEDNGGGRSEEGRIGRGKTKV